MSPDPIRVRPDTSVGEAWTLMKERRIRHLPVVDEGDILLGLLTERDILSRAPNDDEIVTTHMRHQVQSVDPSCCVGAAARFMLQTKMGSLLVVDDAGALVGILTEADFVRGYVRRTAPCACEPRTFIGVE